MRNNEKIAFVLAMLVIMLSWAVNFVTSKVAISDSDLEGAAVPIQRQRHARRLSWPGEMHCPRSPPPCSNEMHCPRCPPCPMAQAPAPTKMYQQKHPPARIAHPPASAPKASMNNSIADVPDSNSPTAEKEPQAVHKVENMSLKLCGDLLIAGSFLLPFIINWSTGSVESTMKFYTKATLGSNAFSSYSWLLFSTLRISFVDKHDIIGVDAIIVNGISWGMLGFMLMALLMHEWPTGKGMVCIYGLSVHVTLTIAVVHLPVLRYVKSNDLAKHVVGWSAASMQVTSEIIPLVALWKEWRTHPVPQPQIRNYKKILIFSRAIDSFITLYWMQYCVSTYEFDEFGYANIVSAVLSLLSFCAYSAWALGPNEE